MAVHAAAGSSGLAGAAAEMALATANTAEGAATAAQTTATAALTQASAAGASAATALGVAGRAQALAQTSVQYDDASKSSVTLNPGGAAATVHNVAAGVASTDAADVGQVTGAVQTAESYTDTSSAATLSAANNYTDAVAARLNSRIDQVSNRANAGIAASLASSYIPQAIRAGHAMVGFGVGTWGSEAGFAAGLSTRLRDDHTTFKAGVNFTSRGQGGGGAGVGYEF
jgi:autotransporter adhesin